MNIITTISAGLSNPSSTSRLTKSIENEIHNQHSDTKINSYELKEYGHEILDRMFTGFNSEHLDNMIKTVEQSDGLILNTPIFNTGPSGLFKSFLDILEPTKFDGMPVVLAATGGSERHSLSVEYNIRPIMTYFRMEPTTTSIYASSNDWALNGEDSLSRRIERAVAELSSRLNNTTASHKKEVLDEFDPANYLGEGKSFADLLRTSNYHV